MLVSVIGCLPCGCRGKAVLVYRVGNVVIFHAECSQHLLPVFFFRIGMGIPESQNGEAWEGPLEITQSNLLQQLLRIVSRIVSSFWISPGKETPQLLWGDLLPDLSHPCRTT